MIRREAEVAGRRSVALYSDCETYRYSLSRRWSDGPLLTYVMLNPSKADEHHNDPTIERCERRARMLGFSAFEAVNLFAYRATDPAELKAAAEPEGKENQQVILDATQNTDLLLLAWGVHGDHLDQAGRMTPSFTPFAPHCLGTTKSGAPRHPLYVSYKIAPEPWVPLTK